MADDPLKAISRLMEKVGEVAEGLGLHLEGFAVLPSQDPNGAHACQALFHLDPAVVFADDEQRKIDRQFAEMAMIERLGDLDTKVIDAGQKLRDTLADLERGDGLGLDDDEPGS